MGNPFGIGVKKENSEEDNFKTAIFYFMKEFGINPFDERNNITIPLFQAMMEEMSEHYKRESEAMKKSNKGR